MKGRLCQVLNVTTRDFKQSRVNLYQTGKTQTELCKDYDLSSSALAKWIKQYSQIALEDNTIVDC